ncbi:MAG: thiamine phosphate synthase [Muribaculaceae bacterium]|nr:thiamine phosphate synthase [Muribaculaceae bacterium]
MVQYILSESEKYSPAELAQMAIEGGCAWISLHFPELTDDELRQVAAPDIVDMCRDAGVILTIDDRPALARDLNVHGVRLSRRYFTDNPSETPLKIRDELGPEAIIGVEIADSTAPSLLVGADVDFVTLPADFTSEQRTAFVEAVRLAGIPTAIVASGIHSPAEATAAVIADGCSGVAVGAVIAAAPDPVERMMEFINVLSAD